MLKINDIQEEGQYFIIMLPYNGLLLIMMVENVFLKSFPKHFQHFSISWTCRRLWTLILGPKWTKIVYFLKKAAQVQ